MSNCSAMFSLLSPLVPPPSQSCVPSEKARKDTKDNKIGEIRKKKKEGKGKGKRNKNKVQLSVGKAATEAQRAEISVSNSVGTLFSAKLYF